MKSQSLSRRLLVIGIIGLGLCLAATALVVWGSRYFFHTLPAVQFPLQITRVTVGPEPKVGQPATLRVEFSSYENEADVRLIIQLPPGIKQMGGSLEWQGSLVANQLQTHEVPICVLYEGDWEIYVGAGSQKSAGSSYGDSKFYYIRSTASSAQVIPGDEYHIPQPPGGFVDNPTPLLPHPPANICQ